MPNKTLYLRDEDAPIWEWAGEAARKQRRSTSALVTEALKQYLISLPDSPPCPTCQPNPNQPTPTRTTTQPLPCRPRPHDTPRNLT